jgi:hypothetical protein
MMLPTIAVMRSSKWMVASNAGTMAGIPSSVEDDAEPKQTVDRGG